MRVFLRDLGYAARALRATPGFTTVAVLTLALGIGATTAIFSVVDAVLLRPLPYGEPDRLVRVWSSWEGEPHAAVSEAELFDYRERVGSFADVGVYVTGPFNLTGGNEPDRVQGGAVSASLLPTLGVAPPHGRAFHPDEEKPGHHRVVLLGDGLWRRRFGGETSVVGSSVVLEGEPYTVVGVLPPGFRLPDDFGAALPAELLVPLPMDPALREENRGGHYLNAVARLRPGATLDSARRDLAALTRELAREHTQEYPPGMRFAATSAPLHEAIFGNVRPALLVLLGAVALVLLIAAVNVATLLFARAESRRREISVRAALGASRSRILRQLLTESLLLALLGGLAGTLLALWGTGALVRLHPPEIPRLGDVHVDLRVLGFALATSLATGVAFGLLPALHGAAPDLQHGLKEGTRSTAAGGRQRWTRPLIAMQIALAVVLLVGAGLLARSFLRLSHVDPGFRPENVLTVELSLPLAEYPEEGPSVVSFFRGLLERVSAVPGVRAAGAVAGLPLASSRGDWNIQIEGRPQAEEEQSWAADWQVVTPGYFAAIGTPVVRGRDVTAADDEDAARVVVVNQSMARRYWPGEDPIGKRFRMDSEGQPWMTVVGVVGDVHHDALHAAARPEMYLPQYQFRFGGVGSSTRTMTLVVRTSSDPRLASRAVAREIAALDPNLPRVGMRTMEEVLAASVARPRFTTTLLAIFGAAALLLAAAGIYGVVSYAVSRRTHEIGVRVALGARPADVVVLLLRQTGSPAGAGVLAGILVALALAPLLRSQLYATPPADPLTYATITLVLTGAVAAATLLPARHALRVDPLVALRSE